MDFNLRFDRKPVVREVLLYPNPILSQVSTPILDSIKDDEELQGFLDDLVVTMQAYKGVGLAAIQCGVPITALVVQDQRQEPIKVINPSIKDTDGESYVREGCLSIPGLYTKVRRASEVTIEYFNENGELKTTINDGLLGRAILHEMDHLLGLTIFDRLSKVERTIALEKYKKVMRKLKAA